MHGVEASRPPNNIPLSAKTRAVKVCISPTDKNSKGIAIMNDIRGTPGDRLGDNDVDPEQFTEEVEDDEP